MEGVGGGSSVHSSHPQEHDDISAKRCHCPVGGRNLVVCIDGTSNQFGEKVSLFTIEMSVAQRSHQVTIERRTRMSLNCTV